MHCFSCFMLMMPQLVPLQRRSFRSKYELRWWGFFHCKTPFRGGDSYFSKQLFGNIVMPVHLYKALAILRFCIFIGWDCVFSVVNLFFYHREHGEARRVFSLCLSVFSVVNLFFYHREHGGARRFFLCVSLCSPWWVICLPQRARRGTEVFSLCFSVFSVVNLFFYHREHGGAQRFLLSVFLCVLRGEFIVFIFFLI
jgi:hypothetical protein